MRSCFLVATRTPPWLPVSCFYCGCCNTIEEMPVSFLIPPCHTVASITPRHSSEKLLFLASQNVLSKSCLAASTV